MISVFIKSQLFHRVLQLRLGIIGLVLVLGVVFFAVFAPFIAPHDIYKQNIANKLAPPFWSDKALPGHYLGTDHLGRDILSRLIYGSRISLMVGISAVLISAIIGVMLGVTAGYYGSYLDIAINNFVNTIMSFPFILLALAVVAILGASLQNVIIVLGITTWPVYTRIVRGQAARLKGEDYVLAAKVLGVSDPGIILLHILPNVLSSVIVIASIEVGRAIIQESLLSFLGLGVQPPTPSWGTMLSEGRLYMLDRWWLAAFPGMAIFITVLGINFLGDALRDLLDPRLKEEG